MIYFINANNLLLVYQSHSRNVHHRINTRNEELLTYQYLGLENRGKLIILSRPDIFQETVSSISTVCNFSNLQTKIKTFLFQRVLLVYLSSDCDFSFL